jgi:hypothetical protein
MKQFHLVADNIKRDPIKRLLLYFTNLERNETISCGGRSSWHHPLVQRLSQTSVHLEYLKKPNYYI